MKSSKFRVFGMTFFMMLAAQNFIGLEANADDLRQWQKGVIEGAFLFHSHLNAKDVRIEIQNDCAILKGYVDSEVGKSLAEQLALSVKGINQVINKLVVTPDLKGDTSKETDWENSSQHRLSNVTITNKVRSQLLANRVTSGMEIDVETRNRVVTLSGVVNSEAEKVLTYWIVKNTQGVTRVIDKLDVLPGNQQAVVQLAE
jgi:hyperosmotically inducible protein